MYVQTRLSSPAGASDGGFSAKLRHNSDNHKKNSPPILPPAKEFSLNEKYIND